MRWLRSCGKRARARCFSRRRAITELKKPRARRKAEGKAESSEESQVLNAVAILGWQSRCRAEGPPHTSLGRSPRSPRPKNLRAESPAPMSAFAGHPLAPRRQKMSRAFSPPNLFAIRPRASPSAGMWPRLRRYVTTPFQAPRAGRRAYQWCRTSTMKDARSQPMRRFRSCGKCARARCFSQDRAARAKPWIRRKAEGKTESSEESRP